MSIYRIDPEPWKEDGIVLLKLSDRAHAETIITVSVFNDRPRAKGLAP